MKHLAMKCTTTVGMARHDPYRRLLFLVLSLRPKQTPNWSRSEVRWWPVVLDHQGQFLTGSTCDMAMTWMQSKSSASLPMDRPMWGRL